MKVLRLAPRYWHLEKHLQQYAIRESWSATELHAYQLERLNQLWTHARLHVAYYRLLADTNPLPMRFASLQEFTATIPILPKHYVRDNPDNFLSELKEPGGWLQTSGSTGVPTRVYWSRKAHRTMLCAKYRSEQAYGLDFLDRRIFFWGDDAAFKQGFLGFIQQSSRSLQDRLRNRLRLSSYELAESNLTEHLKRIQSFAPRSIYGCSSAIDLLARTAQERNFDLPSLKLAILTGEPADPRMLRRVEQGFGCQAVIEYGSVECGLIAYRMPDGTIRTRDDVVFVETVANFNGGFDLLITVLDNPSFPLLRYRIGDTTSAVRQQPSHGFGILQDIQGRSNDILVTQTGKRLHSMAFRHRLESHPEIRRFTAIQAKCGSLRVTVEAASPVSAEWIAKLQNMLSELLEGYPVDVELTDVIPPRPAGKHRWIISEISHS